MERQRSAAATGNMFIDSLDEADRARLTDLRMVRLEAGQVLVEQGEVPRDAHFPIDAQLTNLTLLASGQAIETAVIGREGLSGLAPVLAAAASPWRIEVRAGGEALIASAGSIRRAQRDSPAFEARLMQLTLFYQAQAVQDAACNAVHRVSARVARWLLIASDLTPGAAVSFTQEEMANLLGAQRTTVVEAFNDLKAESAIRHSRGRVAILDRTRLEGRACECYRAVADLAARLHFLPDGDAA